MAVTDVRKDVIGIVNEVERRLGTNESSTLTDNKRTRIIVDFLNDCIDEINDFGNWPQMYREVEVSAVSGTSQYELAVSAQVKNVQQVFFNTNAAPLLPVDVPTINHLLRTSSQGTPRQFSVVDVSGVNPRVRVFPKPASNEDGKTFTFHYYKKNRLYTTSSVDSSAIPAFPSRMLVQGTYAKMLLEEAGQEETTAYRVAYQEYTRMRQEAFNRFTADTGHEIQFVPVKL